MSNNNQEFKYDKGKPRISLVEPYIIEEIAEVLTYGANKYEARSWMKTENGKERYEDALLRHTMSYLKGEVLDEESGLPHLSHMATNIMFLSYFSKQEVVSSDTNVCISDSNDNKRDIVSSMIDTKGMTITLITEDLQHKQNLHILNGGIGLVNNTINIDFFYIISDKLLEEVGYLTLIDISLNTNIAILSNMSITDIQAFNNNEYSSVEVIRLQNMKVLYSPTIKELAKVMYYYPIPNTDHYIVADNSILRIERK